MNQHLERISVNLPFILVAIGVICGLISFFVNWESVTVVNTSGFNFAFGNRHDDWFNVIGNRCYIPLVLFLCTIGAFLTVSIATFRKKNSYIPMLVCFILGLIMILCMTTWSATSMFYSGNKIYFTDYIGIGTMLAWTAASFTMIGGGVYVASRWGSEHGE